jgi:class 3 adenylate cyclase/tetratricopeptide (TPR) repeat protein
MRCDRCGLESPAGFRFCGSCGAPLPGTEVVALTEERKVVTALFCDLVGFTPRAEQMDPEDVHRLLRGYYASVRGVLERFGGTVAKYIGDAVFAVFGAPRAHEDDAARAVRAALATLEAVAELNARDPELDLHVHIGVTTGEALVTFDPQPGLDEGVAWGDMLNTAARLEAAAPGDSILVDEATYRATRTVIEYAATARIRAKGKAEPVTVWRPRALRRRRLGLAPGPADRRQLVDRTDELRRLTEIFDDAHERRAPRLVTLVGDAGLGKSFLVLELFRRTETRAGPTAWRLGRSPPYPEGVAFWALSEIIKAQSGVLETDGAAAVEEKLRQTVLDLVPAADAERIETHLLGLLGLRAAADARGDQRAAAFAAWRQFLEALARRRSLVLVFEDLHWADEGLLDFIEHVVEWARDAPLLVLTTTRPELLARRERWGAHASAETLALAPLSTPDTRKLVSLSAARPMPADVSEGIVVRASGNPLYAVEFVSMLADRGLVTSGAEELPLPDSLRGIIAARLDLLSVEEKALIQAGAVMGRAVWPRALAAIMERSRQWVTARLRTLEEKELLVRARRSSLGREPEFRFRHVLIRDVAYEEIPRRRRGQLHRRTAEWLAALSPGRDVDRAELLAEHWLCAYVLAGRSGRELAEHTRLAQADAGDRAMGLHAFAAAARFFEAALDLWPDDDPERPGLLFRLGKSRYYAETAGADVLAEARDALLAAGDPGTAAEAEAFLAILAHHEGRREGVAEHLNRAADLVAALGPTRSKADVLIDVANWLALAREHDQTIAVATEALAIAGSLREPELEASALSIIGITRGWSGDLGGREDLWRSIAITEEIGSHLSAHACGLLADLEGQMGDLTTCFELQARARRHAERFGHAAFVRWLAAEHVGESYWTGAWDDAMRRADAFIAEVEAGRPHFMDGYCRTMRGRIRLARGDAEGALADAERALAFAREAEDLQMLYPALALAGYAQVAGGSVPSGAALADELLALWRSKPGDYPASSWAVDLACALGPLGRQAELAEAAASVAVRSRWLEATVALVVGDRVAAAEEFDRIGSRPDAALARLREGQALLGDGHRRDGLTMLRRAHTFYAGVEASARLDEIAEAAGPGFVTGVARA